MVTTHFSDKISRVDCGKPLGIHVSRAHTLEFRQFCRAAWQSEKRFSRVTYFLAVHRRLSTENANYSTNNNNNRASDISNGFRTIARLTRFHLCRRARSMISLCTLYCVHDIRVDSDASGLARSIACTALLCLLTIMQIRCVIEKQCTMVFVR